MAADESRSRPEETAADTVAGLLAAVALAAGAIALVWYPGRVGPVAMLVVLIAAALGGAQRRFIAISVLLVTLFWFFGMVIAVVTERPIF
jgi:hypothetical protein